MLALHELALLLLTQHLLPLKLLFTLKHLLALQLLLVSLFLLLAYLLVPALLLLQQEAVTFLLLQAQLLFLALLFKLSRRRLRRAGRGFAPCAVCVAAGHGWRHAVDLLWQFGPWAGCAGWAGRLLRQALGSHAARHPCGARHGLSDVIRGVRAQGAPRLARTRTIP